MMQAAAPDFDSRAFRDALGRFATGVTVITTRSRDGRRVGLTASSFNSVSLDPPLVLWSLGRKSSLLADFERCNHYAINVLADTQQGLSQQFATSAEDRFTGVICHDGTSGTPLLAGCIAWFECFNLIRHEAGDHILFIGQVERCGTAPGDPLIWQAGDYRQLNPSG